MATTSKSSKELAEAAKLEVETSGLKAEERRKAAEEKRKAQLHVLALRKQEAEVAKLEADVRLAQDTAAQEAIKRAQAEYAEQKRLAHDYHSRQYRFTSDVNNDSVKSCISQLNEWDRMYPGEPIEIIFYSPGGNVMAGLALFDHIQYLRAQGHHVTIGALGYAASMAGILLQAGDTRWVGRESWVLIHEISTLAIGSTTMVEDEVAFCKRIQNRVINIFLSRGAATVGEENTITEEAFRHNWERKDWWLDSDELLRLGFVDEVR